MNRSSLEALPRRTINGVSLAVRETGRGVPVVLVHGGVSDIRTWDRQVPALGRRYRVISYSRRYARPNEDIPEDVDDPMAPHVEDLIALLSDVNAVPAHLVGHSWGAFICLLAAIGSPEAVRSLVLMEPPVLTLFVSNPPRPAELLRVLLRRPRTAAAILRFGAGAVSPAQKAFRRGDDDTGLRALGRGVLGPRAFSRLAESRREQIRANLGTDKAQLLGAGFPPLDDAAVRGIRAPTLLLHGEQSPALFPRLLDRLEELLPNVERFEVPGASHILHEDNPDTVNERVLAFLNECDRNG